MMYVSCAVGNIYRNGAWFDDPRLLNEFTNGSAASAAPEVCAEIYAPYAYQRTPPALFGDDVEDVKRVSAIAAATNRDYGCGPASVLVKVNDACVSRAIIYMISGTETRIVYETHRPNDRSASAMRHESDVRLVDDYRKADPFIAYFWLGSPGSMNYGHWLVDDLPRLYALTELRRMRPYAKIIVVTPDSGPAHNQVHVDSCAAICASLAVENVEIMFVSREAKVFFQELYFASPVTHHPVMKSPEAMRFVFDRVDPGEVAADDLPKRLFIVRAWTGRRDLANQQEIISLLKSRGFRAVDTGGMPFLAQSRLLRNATVVVGCMGASMTNTLFAAEGSRIGHIAPQGWVEPFYWDLATVRRHHYAACYGTATPQEGPPWEKNFRVNPKRILEMVDFLEEAPIL